MRRKRKVLLIIPALAVVLAAACLYFIARTDRELKALSSIPIEDVDLSAAEDGTYTGSYSAFPVSATVDVTLRGGRITGIELVEHENGRGSAAEAIPDMVVAAQSLQVDAVSGTTFSSKVILLAIEDALKSAAGE